MTVCVSKDLCKTYHNNHCTVNAIANCNLDIGTGECVLLCGGSSSGKTTLLRILGGLERPTSGEVYINGHNIIALSDDELAAMRRKEIGYIFHNDSLIPELTVHENINMPAFLDNKKYDKAYFQDLTEKLQLTEILSRYPKNLTANELQRVAFARALINKPNLILADKPEYDFDQSVDKYIMDFLRDMVYQYHKTLIIVTDHTDNCSFMNHIIRLNDGIVIEDRRISREF